jgi:hypothetical protein
MARRPGEYPGMSCGRHLASHHLHHQTYSTNFPRGTPVAYVENLLSVRVDTTAVSPRTSAVPCIHLDHRNTGNEPPTQTTVVGGAHARFT